MAMLHTADSTASPVISARSSTLSFPVLARIVSWPIKYRHRRAASSSSTEGIEAVSSLTPQSPPKSPPRTPRSKAKALVLECSSGDVLKTHYRIVDAKPECRNAATVKSYHFFECKDGVDSQRLLGLARGKVMERVEQLGGNTIVNEGWSCSISRTNKNSKQYRVYITYEGTPARCDLPDPGRPVALDQARGVAGLMTVISRESRYEGAAAKLIE